MTKSSIETTREWQVNRKIKMPIILTLYKDGVAEKEVKAKL